MKKTDINKFLQIYQDILIKHISPSVTSQDKLTSLLPSYTPHTILLGDGLPCHGAQIASKPIKTILKKIKRQVWAEGLYARNKDLNKIIRYKNSDGNHKNDFDKTRFLKWIEAIENNTALCEMENKSIGKGVFVPPGKTLPQGTFIPSSGIIKLNPTVEELAIKVHCSALQNLNSLTKEVVGLIDPEKIGGILNFINHAPDKDEIANFIFKDSFVKENVALSNLRSIIKFYNGYAIMGLEAIEDINGGEHGTQLLWSYARSCEYIVSNKTIFLFDNRSEQSGEIIDANKYTLKEIDIYIDTGELIIRKVASLTRWELMQSSPESGLVISTEDPYSVTQAKPIQSLIPHKFLQTYLKNNPVADRVIIQVPILKAMRTALEKKDI